MPAALPLSVSERSALPVPRVLAVLGVGLGVLLLHLALLGWLPHTAGGPLPGALRPAVQPLQLRARVLAVPVPVPAPDAGQVPAPEQAPEPPPVQRPAPQPRPQPALASGAAPTQAPTPAAVAALPAAAPDADADAPTEGAPPAALAALPAGTTVPTYATRLAPPATLQYTVQRSGGGAGGSAARAGLQAQLLWRPEAGAYTLSLGLGATGSASVGALDLHGIAPERHVETRRGREVRAANFQRQAGRITFSGPRIEHALLPGVQDRLSWMLQLGAVLAAEPALGQPGREVTLLVVGVRGEAALWVFRVQAVQALSLPAGEVQNAVHLVREAERPFDTRVDVWLDPARHHLPVRLRLRHRAEGPSTEFELLGLTF